MTHRHSAIALGLRTGVLSSETVFAARLAHLQSWSAVHGRSDCKLEEVTRMERKLYVDAMEVIPYLTGGRSSDSLAADEAAELARQYEEFKAAHAAKGHVVKA